MLNFNYFLRHTLRTSIFANLYVYCMHITATEISIKNVCSTKHHCNSVEHYIDNKPYSQKFLLGINLNFVVWRSDLVKVITYYIKVKCIVEKSRM